MEEYEKLLKEFFAGSATQQKRGARLEKEKVKLIAALEKKRDKQNQEELERVTKEQLRFYGKVLEGAKNALRSFSIRLFVLRFQNKELHNELALVRALLEEFMQVTLEQSRCVQKNSEKEKACKNDLSHLLERVEKKRKKLTKLQKKQPLRELSYIILADLMLALVLALYKPTPIPKYPQEVFAKENRYSPLNPFFPFK